MTGHAAARAGEEPTHLRALRHARRRHARRLPRRPPLRHVAAARAGRARAVPRDAARRGAARRVHGQGARRAARGRRAPLKAALLDQRTLAGLGNIYVDEALWYARLHPLRQAGELDDDELRRLHRGDPRALELGIAPAGLDAHATTGSRTAPSGSMQREFRVYGRDGRAVRPLRHADREDPRRRPRHLVLPALPAALRKFVLVEPPHLCTKSPLLRRPDGRLLDRSGSAESTRRSQVGGRARRVASGRSGVAVASEAVSTGKPRAVRRRPRRSWLQRRRELSGIRLPSTIRSADLRGTAERSDSGRTPIAAVPVGDDAARPDGRRACCSRRPARRPTSPRRSLT